MEYSGSSSSGYVTLLNIIQQQQTRLTTSGDYYEQALTIDSQAGYMWWSTCGNGKSVWKASLAHINEKAKIWSGSKCPVGLVVVSRDHLIFVDQSSAGLMMLSYDGHEIDNLRVTEGDSNGLAVDQLNRLVFIKYI